MTAKKKIEIKPGTEAEGTVSIEMKPEPYHPMAVPEPTTEDRLEALTVEMKVIKDWINRHNRSHFGRDAL